MTTSGKSSKKKAAAQAAATAADTVLHTAAKQGNLEAIQTLLEVEEKLYGSYPSLLTPNEQGHTPLHCAVNATHPKCAVTLLDAYDHPGQWMNKGNETPLAMAYNTGQTDVFLMLEEAVHKTLPPEADRYDVSAEQLQKATSYDDAVAILTSPPCEKTTPAVREEAQSVAAFIIKALVDDAAQQGFEKKQKESEAQTSPAENSEQAPPATKKGKKHKKKKNKAATQQEQDLQPLLSAIETGSLKEVKSSMKTLSVNENLLVTALCKAVEHSHFNIAEYMLGEGAQTNEPDATGHTPLHLSAMADNIEMTELLLKNGASTTASTTTGQTPLHLAAALHHEDVVETLLNWGANINAPDNDGKTPVQTMPGIRALYPVPPQEMTGHKTYNVRNAIVHSYQDNKQNLEAMMKTAYKHMRDDKKAFIHFTEEHPLLVSMLPDKGNSLFLHYAASIGDKDVIDALLDLGSDVNHADDGGHTPLFIAVDNGDERTARQLIDAGASVDVKNRNGITPFDIALNKRHTKCIGLLAGCGAEQGAIDVYDDADPTPHKEDQARQDGWVKRHTEQTPGDKGASAAHGLS